MQFALIGNSHRLRLGLTMVELLVAMTIFAVIITLTIGVLLKVQSVQNKLDQKSMISQVIRSTAASMTHDLKAMNKMLVAATDRIEYINDRGDTVCYYLRQDTLWLNDKPVTGARIDTIEFQYFLTSRPDAIDLYAADKNGDGVLTADELNGIAAVRVILGWFEIRSGKKYPLRREIFAALRNTLVLSR